MRSILKFKTLFFALGLSTLLLSCNKASTGGGSSYSFTAASTASFRLTSRSSREVLQSERVTGPTLCSSVICFTPTKLTGKYYGTGFLIQSSGNGMVAYFGQDSWANITSSSTTYSFDSSSPVTNSGNLTCCNGTGDFTSSNTYIESVMYLFGYLDATFTVSGVTGNTSMNREFTVRFVLADGAITSGIRGDLLLKDPSDGIFKWIDTSVSAGGNVGAGTLVTTRPTSPVTMNTSVVSYSNPFGSQGNQTIPVIYAPVVPASGSGLFEVTEASLSAANKSYTYKFNPTNFVMFPQLLTADINMLSSYTALLQKIHLGGLPHSAQTSGVGSPASTVLTVE